MDCACVYSETCVRRLVVKTEEGVSDARWWVMRIDD